MNKAKIAIIDADGLTYHSSKETLEESINTINERILNIFEKTGATHYVMFISNSPYFRHKIDPEYKSSRKKYESNLKWLKTLKSYLIENWNAQSMKNVEADDLCAYWTNQDICIDDNGTHFEPRHIFESALDICKTDNFPEFTFESVEKVLCSPDKDLLQSIEGKHFNYSYKLAVKDDPSSVVKGWWVETSLADALKFKNMQLIVGDDADDVKTPFPENCGIYNSNLDVHEILHGYIWGMYYETPKGQKKTVEGLGYSKGIYEFQKNYRLLHLLDCNEDFMREVNELPIMPVISEVPKVINKNDEIIEDI